MTNRQPARVGEPPDLKPGPEFLLLDQRDQKK
jgi:hypothetical protein